MYATRTFLPKANSPISVEGPSASTSPSATKSPLDTMVFWLKHVPWLDLPNFRSLYTSFWPVSVWTTISSAEAFITWPLRLASVITAESKAALCSKPVPTYGASGLTSGTACRCMFDPIRARLASSCSKKGISEVATENTCFGDTSI